MPSWKARGLTFPNWWLSPRLDKDGGADLDVTVREEQTPQLSTNCPDIIRVVSISCECSPESSVNMGGCRKAETQCLDQGHPPSKGNSVISSRVQMNGYPEVGVIYGWSRTWCLLSWSPPAPKRLSPSWTWWGWIHIQAPQIDHGKPLPPSPSAPETASCSTLDQHLVHFLKYQSQDRPWLGKRTLDAPVTQVGDGGRGQCTWSGATALCTYQTFTGFFNPLAQRLFTKLQHQNWEKNVQNWMWFCEFLSECTSDDFLFLTPFG